MRVVVDSNVLISALISPSGAADLVYKAWRAGDLAAALGGRVDYLVTGDKSGLLSLGHYGRTRIVTIRKFLSLLA